MHAIDELGIWMFRLGSLLLSGLLELLAPLGKNSIERTMMKGYAKGYKQIATGKIKLPEVIKPRLRAMTLLFLLSFLIDPLVTIVKQVLR